MKNSQRERLALLNAIRGKKSAQANDLAVSHVLDASNRLIKGEPLWKYS